MSLLFISHAAQDAPIAEFIEAQVRRLVTGVEVFRTSRTGQILPGDEWFGVVTEHLRKADEFLVLVTPNSVSRPWMWFEAGAAWMTSRPMVPVTVGLSKDSVPEPLRFFQIYSLETADEARIVFHKLGATLSDADMFCSAIKQLTATVIAEAEATAGWKGIQLDRYFIAIDGPLEEYQIAAPVAASPKILDALKAAQFELTFAEENSKSRQLAKGYCQVWAIDRQFKRRHPLVEEHGQILLGRSESDAP